MGLVACGLAAAPESTTGTSRVQSSPSPPVNAPAQPNELSSRLWPEARAVEGYGPRRAIDLTEVPSYPWDGEDGGSRHYRNVVEHTPEVERWFGADVGLTTNAHETHHGRQGA